MTKTPNLATFDAEMKCEQVLGDAVNVMVSISGGADSDVMLDLIYRKNKEHNFACNIHYVFFNTGIEMQATLDHLDYLEKKYNIKIERAMANVPVPLGCIRFGQPFLSKYVSSMIQRLQERNFDFANDGNKTFEELCEKYPRCIAGLKWWCNKHPQKHEYKSMFNINNNKWLKEYMIANPPNFKISNLCCNGAKKNTAHKWESENKCDTKCVGLRKAEGGIRKVAVKTCFSDRGGQKTYRPIFWFTDKDRKEYEEFFNVVHSKCYTDYGFKRTGCCGCPYGSDWEEELEIIKPFEPMLYKAANNIFGKSYDYTRGYRKFKKEMNAMQEHKLRKNITISANVWEHGKQKGKEKNMTFSEYLEYLIMKEE